MNPEVESPKPHKFTAKAERSASRARRFGAGLLAVAIATAGFLAVPQQASAARAGANSDRRVEVLVSCTSTSVSLGSTATCTGSVRDTESGGTKTVPRGTVALTVDSGRIGVLTACTSAYVATANRSDCSFKIVNLSNGNGQPALKLTYTQQQTIFIKPNPKRLI
jgi:hypothetical protein